MSKESKSKWRDGKIAITAEVLREDGEGKVRVLITLAARYLEDHPELVIHHEVFSGERWKITAASCGYGIVMVSNLDHARFAIERLLEAAKEIDLDWSMLTAEEVPRMPHNKRKAIVEALHDIKYYSKS